MHRVKHHADRRRSHPARLQLFAQQFIRDFSASGHFGGLLVRDPDGLAIAQRAVSGEHQRNEVREIAHNVLPFHAIAIAEMRADSYFGPPGHLRKKRGKRSQTDGVEVHPFRALQLMEAGGSRRLDSPAQNPFGGQDGVAGQASSRVPGVDGFIKNGGAGPSAPRENRPAHQSTAF